MYIVYYTRSTSALYLTEYHSKHANSHSIYNIYTERTVRDLTVSLYHELRRA